MTKIFQQSTRDENDVMWLIRWLLGAFLSVALVVGGAWASGLSTAVDSTEKRSIINEQSIKNMDRKLDEILAEVKELRKNAR